jgi:hypothetical protein
MAIGESFAGIPSGTRYVKLSMGPIEASKLYALVLSEIEGDGTFYNDDKHLARIADALADAGVSPDTSVLGYAD